MLRQIEKFFSISAICLFLLDDFIYNVYVIKYRSFAANCFVCIILHDNFCLVLNAVNGFSPKKVTTKPKLYAIIF